MSIDVEKIHNEHSAVQDVVEPTNKSLLDEDFDDEHLLKKKDVLEVLQDGKTQIGSFSTQLSTVSNNSDGALFCDICNIRVTSSKILQRHLEGRKHKSRAERRGKIFRCEICDINANSEIQLNIHLSSSKHRSRIARDEYKEFFDVSAYSKSIYVLFFAIFCIILNLIIMLKVAL